MNIEPATTQFAHSFNTQAQTFAIQSTRNFQQVTLLEAVINCYSDGILVLTSHGKLVYSNETAQTYLHQLAPSGLNSCPIPPDLWAVCQRFLEEVSHYSDQYAVTESEVTIAHHHHLHVRVRWLVLDQVDQPCLIVTLLDQERSLKNLALSEAKHYGFTPSETRVWSLYRANYSYKQIATQLFITLNTVKKHMKSIHSKRRFLDEGN